MYILFRAQMKEEAEQQEGLVRFGISKTLSDNRLFLAYEVGLQP